ncbi:hypothetical protein D9M69_475390 [compost metagenome]
MPTGCRRRAGQPFEPFPACSVGHRTEVDARSMAGVERHHCPWTRQPRTDAAVLPRSVGKSSVQALRPAPDVPLHPVQPRHCRRRFVAGTGIEPRIAGVGATGRQPLVRSTGALRSRPGVASTRGNLSGAGRGPSGNAAPAELACATAIRGSRPADLVRGLFAGPAHAAAIGAGAIAGRFERGARLP